MAGVPWLQLVLSGVKEHVRSALVAFVGGNSDVGGEG